MTPDRFRLLKAAFGPPGVVNPPLPLLLVIVMLSDRLFL